MPTVINFNRSSPIDVGAQRVYVRQNWADTWTYVGNEMYPREVIWSVSPAIPTASIVRWYGDLKRYHEPTFSVKRKVHYDRHFVKIEWDTRQVIEGEGEEATLVQKKLAWYGVLHIEADDMDGSVQRAAAGGQKPSGTQLYTAYGLEILLANHVIWNWHWERDSDQSIRTVWGVAPDFNANGEGNRAANVNAANSVYHFADSLATAEFWSSQAIANYLIEWQTPRDATGNVKVPFAIDAGDLAKIPSWDEPVVQQHHQTTFSLLNRLIDRRRLMHWWLDVDEVANEVKLKTATAIDAAFNTGAGTIPANEDTLSLRFDFDPASSGAVKLSDVDRADQVLVRGAPIRVAGSFQVDKGNLEAAWESGDEVAYHEGASNTITYATLDRDEQQRRNAEVRGQPDLAAVFSQWKIPDDWDRQSWDFTADLGVDMFPRDPDDVWLPGLRIEPTLPFTVGKIEDEIPPLVLFPHSDNSARYIRADQIGLTQTEIDKAENYPQFSVAVSVTPDQRGIQLRTTGAPQYALMGDAEFAGMIADMDPYYGNWDATAAVFTLSMRDQHMAEAFWPATQATYDAGRTIVIDAGDSYQRTYIAPGTVIGVDDDGALVKHVGGFIRDDKAKLEAIAKTAWQIYGEVRKALTLQTYRIDERLALGKYVSDIATKEHPNVTHYQTIGTVITQIRLINHEQPAGDPQSPVQEITTAAMELDALRLVPRNAPVDPRQVGVQRAFPDVAHDFQPRWEHGQVMRARERMFTPRDKFDNE